MSEPIILSQTDRRGIARITMNRPELRNAFDAAMIAAITASINALSADPNVRVIVLTGAGKAFSAGADIKTMRDAARYTEEENIADANRLTAMLVAIDQSPKPVIALVNGPAIGGGVGLTAACDIAIGVETAFFALSETRLGLIPAAISPIVIRAIGARRASRYFLTGERFDAETAASIGLLHAVAPANEFEETSETLIDALLKCGPNAQASAKDLIRAVAGQPIDAALMDNVARRIANIRASKEGQEGLDAFLEKRAPDWAIDRDD